MGEQSYTGLVLAASRGNLDPLALAGGVSHKGFIDIAGQPMLRRVVEGVLGSGRIGRTIVANLPKEVRVGVVNFAVAGCKIELFEKEDYPAYAATAQPWMTNIEGVRRQPVPAPRRQGKNWRRRTGLIKGILLQGESNTNDKQWPEKASASTTT